MLDTWSTPARCEVITLMKPFDQNQLMSVASNTLDAGVAHAGRH
jgi:hypothetical protein